MCLILQASLSIFPHETLIVPLSIPRFLHLGGDETSMLSGPPSILFSLSRQYANTPTPQPTNLYPNINPWAKTHQKRPTNLNKLCSPPSQQEILLLKSRPPQLPRGPRAGRQPRGGGVAAAGAPTPANRPAVRGRARHQPVWRPQLDGPGWTHDLHIGWWASGTQEKSRRAAAQGRTSGLEAEARGLNARGGAFLAGLVCWRCD
jgi:hypothetical protein